MSPGLMRSLMLSALLVSAGGLVAGCGDDPTPTGNGQGNLCAGESRAETFVMGMDKATSAGQYRVQISDARIGNIPTAPDRGLNTWTVQVLDGAGAAMTDVQLRLRPWMPDHGHGTPGKNWHDGVADGDNYVFGPFDLIMAGYWEFTIEVTEGDTVDSAKFGFCIEG